MICLGNAQGLELRGIWTQRYIVLWAWISEVPIETDL